MTTNPKNAPENYELGDDSTTDSNTKRNPEDWQVPPENKREIRERNLDKTIADSFPTSDPPSTIPNPEEEEDAA
jgi:hypothetical protein